MSKNILILSGNPVENKFMNELIEALIRGIEESYHKVIKVDVSLKQLGYCKACNSIKQPSQSCSSVEDIDDIIQKMIEADTWILVTPVQVYALDAFFRKITNRESDFWVRLHKKAIYYILFANQSNPSAQSITLNSLRGHLNQIDKVQEKGIFYVIGNKQSSLLEAYEMGKKL